MAIATANVPAQVLSDSGGPDSGVSMKSALAMVTTLFFLWGFITCLNDILIPHLKSVFTLNYAEVMLVQTFFFSAYFVFALPSGKVISLIGYKWTMVGGLIVMAAGALLFIPAAMAPSFPLFLVALSVLAAGMTLLQVSANPYVAALGPARTAASRLSMAGAFNSLGTTVAPYVGGLFILGAVPLAPEVVQRFAPAARHAYQVSQASVVKLPYFGIAMILLAFAVAMARFKLPELATHNLTAHPEFQADRSIWEYRHLILGTVAIFVYVGAEVAVGSFMVSYLTQPEIGNLSLKAAAGFVTFYWGGIMVGRVIGAGLMQKRRADRMLVMASIIALLLVGTSMLSFGYLAMWSLILVGLCNSIMWPNIFVLALTDLGPLTNKGSSLLVAAVIGGALVPLAQGVLADRIGIHHAFLLPLLCYLYVGYYGLSGSKVPRHLSSAEHAATA